MKNFAKNAGIGLAWFVGFTLVTNLAVRPLWRKVTAKVNAPAALQAAL